MREDNSLNGLNTLWSSNWDKLLNYRCSLITWKENLKAAEDYYKGTGYDFYLEEVKHAEVVIAQLEHKITELKETFTTAIYNPYGVLQTAPNSTEKELYQAYIRLYNAAEFACTKWSARLTFANSQTEKAAYSNSLEEARYALQQIVKAYKSVKLLKSYTGIVSESQRFLTAKVS